MRKAARKLTRPILPSLFSGQGALPCGRFVDLSYDVALRRTLLCG